jgi:hypothetical protein
MILVIVSLMLATILTASYLASRDNSATIGRNIACSTDSRSTALAGLDLTRAILQTRADWRTASGSATLLDQFPLGDGEVSVEMKDMQTGAAPTATSENIKLTVTATVNGVQEVATAIAFVPSNTTPTVDVDLSEFAIFAADKLEMRNQSTVMRWPKSPLAPLGRRIAIGTQATSASSVVIADDAAAIDATVYAAVGASTSLVSLSNGPEVTIQTISNAVPMPSALSSTFPAHSGSPTDSTFDGGTTLTTTAARSNRVELKNSAVRTLKGSISLVCEEDLRIGSGAKLVIDGQVKVAVFGDLRMDQGAIELKTGSLQLYVVGDASVEIRDSFIGELRASDVRDNSGNAAWLNPQRICIFSQQPSGQAGDWIIRGNSVVKASIYAPDAAKLSIQEQSAVYGRVAARSVELLNDGAVFYDHALDGRKGYTNLDSPLYDDDGSLLTQFRTVTSLDPTILQSLATVTQTAVMGVTYNSSNYAPPAGATTITAVDESEPTPRPVSVDMRLVSFANDVRSWEAENP